MANSHYFEKTVYLIVFIYFICFAFVDVIIKYGLKLEQYIAFIKQELKPELFLKNEKFSIIHSTIDVIGLLYVTVWNPQYFIALLLFYIIVFNFFQYKDTYLRRNFTILEKFNMSLFHSTFQLLPLSLSLTYYDPYDTFMNILFAVVSSSFVFTMFMESKRINSTHDNNTRINQIFALCIVLDYIHTILLLLCKMYTTNNYFFYRFIFQSYPFCLGLQIAICYHEWSYWLRKWRNTSSLVKDLWDGFWFIILLWFVIPIGAECINASWIILLYTEILSKLRHSKNFDEDLKDSLVQWLNEEKDDLLLKICCINHVKLIKGSQQNALLIYLEKHHRNGNKFYNKVSWNGIRNNSVELKQMDLMKTIRDKIWIYYRLDRVTRSVSGALDIFIGDKSFWNFIRLTETSWELGAIGLLLCYGVFSAFNVFSSPWIVLFVMYDALNIHQSCFLMLYWLIMCITLYKLYEMANYERMMWYIIPDLSTDGCTETEIEQFKKHYNDIKYSFAQIQEVLGESMGNDIADIVLLYVPDYIDEYKIEKEFTSSMQTEDNAELEYIYRRK